MAISKVSPPDFAGSDDVYGDSAECEHFFAKNMAPTATISAIISVAGRGTRGLGVFDGCLLDVSMDQFAKSTDSPSWNRLGFNGYPGIEK